MTLTIRRSNCHLNFAYFHQVQDVDIIYFILVTTPQSPGKYRRPKQHVSIYNKFWKHKVLIKVWKRRQSNNDVGVRLKQLGSTGLGYTPKNTQGRSGPHI